MMHIYIIYISYIIYIYIIYYHILTEKARTMRLRFKKTQMFGGSGQGGGDCSTCLSVMLYSMMVLSVLSLRT